MGCNPNLEDFIVSMRSASLALSPTLSASKRALMEVDRN